MWRVLAVLAFLLIFTAVPGAMAGEGNAPELTFHPPANTSPRFQQFFTEYRSMVRSWWEHGGERAARGRWHVTAEEKAAGPGSGPPHFTISVAMEQDGLSQLRVLTFEARPLGEKELFLASHAAYDATLGAILGEYQGHRVWKGLTPGEAVFRRLEPLPIRAAAFFYPRRLLRYRQTVILNAMMDPYQKMAAAAVFIIIGLAGGFWLGRTAGLPTEQSLSRTTPAPSASLEIPPPSTGSMLAGANAIAVNDQPPGLTVVVSLVALERDGWMVIHESDGGGPGRILGAKRFDAGQGSGTAELLRPTEEGRVYFAMLHADDGDRQFNHIKDLPLEDPQGNVILIRFVATKTSSIQ
ncbi:MAG: hypothetical protein HY474_01555 [Candidatus Sungbacteria bacterium]|uniref:DUF7282 domain-containing protein n=1 Tax=Candidatus Sungiibacteriota bacterium TaxID=2750080 RepID=A0A933DRG1_9BACT|nr:hypothetical protein [Candidatus Sungbacteria bacterium]